jgi:hypothetical protein
MRLHSSFRRKQPPTGNNRQIGERQTEGHTHHKAEGLDPSRYDDERQNVGDENVGVELDGVRHDAGIIADGIGLQPKPERAPDLSVDPGRFTVLSVIWSPGLAEMSTFFRDLTFLFFNEIYRAITTRQVHNGRSRLDSPVCRQDSLTDNSEGT